jgi:hypothetical protein
MIYRAVQLRNSIEHFLDLEMATYMHLVRRGDKRPINERPSESVTRVIFDQRMSSDEWAILQELLAILDPIKACTKKLEGRPSEESATGIADVYNVLSLILGQLEKLKVEYAESQKDSAFWVAIEQAWSKATEYYNILDETPVYTAALLLDPRLKYQYLAKEWGAQDAKRGVGAVRRLWEQDYRPNTSPVDFYNSSQSSLSSSQDSELRQPLSERDRNERSRKRMKYSNIDELIKQQRRLPHPQKIGDELTLYLEAELETDDDLVSFQYWLRPAVRTKYPSLTRMAIDILSIPAMSAEAERVFSSAGFILNSRRRRLREETLEAMLCLAHWGKLGLITLAKHRSNAVRGNEMAEVQDVSCSSTSSEGLWNDSDEGE